MAVLNKYHGVPEGAIYIGRGSKWGNPFAMQDKTQAERDRVCEEYSVWLNDQLHAGEVTAEELAELHGKDLVCFCAPKRCHGHSLERVAEQAYNYLESQKEED